jgi:hypothetical protein
MNIAIYNEKWVTPAKCGTRYLDRVFKITTQANNVEKKGKRFRKKIVIYSNELHTIYKMDTITHLILRNPHDLFESAVHTDTWGHISDKMNELGIEENYEFIESMLLKYLNEGTGHWCSTLYMDLYYLLKHKPDIQIIQLSDLTEFVTKETGIKEKYNPTDYNYKLSHFGTERYSREYVINWIKEKFPILWSKIIKLYEIDKVWYDKILYGMYKEIEELPKINKQMYIEMENLPKINKVKRKIV